MGAAVSVNWVTVRSEASVAPGLTIVVTGMMAAAASNETDAVAKATGSSYSIDTDSNNIGAAVVSGARDHYRPAIERVS